MPSSDQIVNEIVIFREDMRWFSESISKLRNQFLNQYVLVKNKKVLLSNRDYDRLIEEAERKEIDLSTSFIEKVLDKNTIVLL